MSAPHNEAQLRTHIRIPFPWIPLVLRFSRERFDELVPDLRRGTDCSARTHLGTTSQGDRIFRRLSHLQLHEEVRQV